MKVTFPHMGTQIFYKKLLELFELDYILPPVPTKKTIDLGVKYSPEFACFPYKVLLGTYIEAIEAGANTILTSGGSGPCRAGLYCEIHKKTLESLGYKAEFIVFDDFGRDPEQFIKNIKRIKGKKSWCKTLYNFYIAYKTAKAADDLQKFIEINRAYEITAGSFDCAFKDVLEDLDKNAHSLKNIEKLHKKHLEILKNIPLRPVPADEKRIKVGIVGEIYVVMENSVNMNIAQVLNNLGCEVTRSMYISDWINHAVVPKIFRKKSGQYLLDYGKKYLDIQIGGHESHNIGNIIDYKKQGYNGIVHLMPFGCLPELVTQTLAPKISTENEIPILTLSLDEQTGIANNLTRIEAFVDLIKKEVKND